MPLITLQNVSKAFGEHLILRGVNLNISEGQILGLIGKSGSGKTTLIRLILGIYNPTTGTITRSTYKQIGYASQETSFYPRLTVEENLLYFGNIFRVPKQILKQRIDYLLNLMSLAYARKEQARNLSGGMKRRLDIALAMINDPPVLILDEPTTGLDIVLQKQLWENILKIKAEGKTILVSSHNIEQLQQYCDDLVFIHEKTLYDLRGIKTLIRQRGCKSLEQLFEMQYQ